MRAVDLSAISAARAAMELAKEEEQRALAALAAGAEVLVVVETDASAGSYDPRLAAVLAEARPHLLFPREHGLSEEQLRRDYERAVVDRCRDAAWHFTLMLPRAAQMGPQGKASPEAGKPARLAKFHFTDSPTEIEIVGHWLPRHVHPADWLDGWLARQGVAPVSSRPLATIAGILGDVLATWDTLDGPFVGRFTTECRGRRLFAVVLRTPIANYQDVAKAHALALSSFEPGPSENAPSAEMG